MPSALGLSHQHYDAASQGSRIARCLAFSGRGEEASKAKAAPFSNFPRNLLLTSFFGSVHFDMFSLNKLELETTLNKHLGREVPEQIVTILIVLLSCLSSKHLGLLNL